MKKIKTKKVNVRIPTSLNDIKLSQYQKLLRAIEDIEDEELINRYMVEIFCNLPESVVRNMTAKSYNEVLTTLNDIFKDIDKEHELSAKIVYNDVYYGFIPNLDDITLGEQIDIDSNLKDWQTMDKAMSIMYRPIKTSYKNKYTIEDYKEMSSLDLPLDVVLGACFFLTNLHRDLLNTIPNYIETELRTNPKLQNLVKNGGGISSFMESLRKTFLISTRLAS